MADPVERLKDEMLKARDEADYLRRCRDEWKAAYEKQLEETKLERTHKDRLTTFQLRQIERLLGESMERSMPVQALINFVRYATPEKLKAAQDRCDE
jgi:hypothetical protein